jgi:sugar (pentulose or hexulose) kinase
VTAQRGVVVGVDLGTSAIKLVAIDEDGAVLGGARRAYPTARPEPGAAEQDPQDWFSALEAALSDLANDVPPDSWIAMGLSAMLPTLVETDERGHALAPAITWEDGRAEPEAEALCAAVGADTVYRITGQRVDGRYLAPMHARLARLGRAGATMCGAKDMLFSHLTGELLTDPSTAAGSGVYDLDADRWDPELVAAAQVPGLPTLAPAATIRPMRSALCEHLGLPAGLPVVLGAADSVLGALGVGAVTHGDVAVIAGTSAVVLGISDAPTRDSEGRYLVTPLSGAGWGLEMDLLAVGSAFEGVARLLGLGSPDALLEAAAAVHLDDAPTFLPYLAPGEQGALWDPDLTGALHGLSLDMTAGHVGRALLTGVVVELRRCIAILADTTGRRGPVLLGGGAASSSMWQDIADATAREVWADPHTTDHSAVGAAILAGDAVGRPVHRRSDVVVVTPREARYSWWTGCLARHDALRQRLGHR